MSTFIPVSRTTDTIAARNGAWSCSFMSSFRASFAGSTARSLWSVQNGVTRLRGMKPMKFPPPTIDDRKRFSGPYERAFIPGVGHFMHIEAPTEIADRVSAWLLGDVVNRQSIAFDRA